MNSKQKIRGAIAAAMVAVGVGAGAYGALVLSSDAVDQEYALQTGAAELMISETQRLQNGLERELEKNCRKTAETYASLRDHARTLERGGLDPSLEPLSFFGFDYFAQKNERPSQLFYSEQEFPEGKSCPAVLRVPESLSAPFNELLVRQHLQSERYRCYESNGSSFMGYLLNSASGRNVHYMYVKKISDGEFFKAPSPSLSQRIAAAFENRADGRLNGIIGNGMVLYASRGFEPLKLRTDLLKSELAHESVDLPSGSALLTSVSRGSLTAVTASSSTSTVAGFYVFGAVVALLSVLIALTILRCGRADDRAEAAAADERRRLLQTLSGHNLLSPESSENLRKELEDFASGDLAETAKAVSALSEAVSAGVADLNKDHRREIDELSDVKFEDGRNRQLLQLQNALIPTAADLPSSRFLDIASYLMPAPGGCTDCYDIFRVDGDNIAIAIGSATQKGTAALKQFGELMPMLRAMMRDQSRDLDASFNELNRMLLERNHSGIGIRLFAMILSEYTGNYVCCNSGMPAPLHLAMGGVSPIEMAPGRPLGINPEEKYLKTKGKLPFGDTILVGSQGYVDHCAPGGEKFGVARLRESLKTQYEQSSAKMLLKIRQDQAAFAPMKQRAADHCVICVKKTNNAQPRD